jgi:hypothetical protein
MRQQCRFVLIPLATVSLVACTQTQTGVQTSNDELVACVQLVLPARLEIQRSLTQPVSFAGDGSADGIEVVLAAYDASDDLTKIVGTLLFELQSRKPAERIGTRVAFWTVEMKTEKALRMYRDRPSRYFDFPLQLEQGPLPAGAYTLSVTLQMPTGGRLLDEYEFTYEGTGAPPVRP